jgi:HAD superfamily hydrolase (TIGR01549 family)
MKNKKVIIFDFDGTLADTLSFTFAIVNKLAKKYRFKEVARTEFEKARNQSAIDIIKKYRIPIWKIPALVYKGQQLLRSEMSRVRFFPGIKEILIELKKRGYRLGILSSNSEENIKIFLENNQGEDLFDFIHSEKNLFGKDKALRNIIKKYNLNKEEVLYVGDEVRDIVACKKVGIDIIAVTWGFNSKTIIDKNKPQSVINSPKQLLPLAF